MIDITEILGLMGALLVAIAYLPQIRHLVKEHCSAGISGKAWLIWLLAAVLILSHAISIQDIVFITLQVLSIILMVILIVLAYKYEGQFCESHMPVSTKKK